MTTGISSIPVECLRLILRELPAADLLRCGRVSRVWRGVSENICQELYRPEWAARMPAPPRPLTTLRELYGFYQAVCRERKRAWENRESHPLSLWAVRGFIKPGKTDIVMDALKAPVEFQEVFGEIYLVCCSMKARLVALPIITPRDSSKRVQADLRDFPDDLGAVRQIAQRGANFYVLAGHGPRLHLLSDQLVPFHLVAADCVESFGYEGGLLVAGTSDGKLILWTETKEQTLSKPISCCIGTGAISCVQVCSIGSQRIVIAMQGEEVVIASHLFTTPRIARFLNPEGCKPFVHGSFLFWKSVDGFTSVDLAHLLPSFFSQWSYARPVAGTGAGGRMLVQDVEGVFFLFNEKMCSEKLGTVPKVAAADFFDGYLLAAYDPSLIILYRKKESGLQEIYRDASKTVEGEKIIQAHFSGAGTIVYSTNNGRFIYGGPIFEGCVKS